MQKQNIFSLTFLASLLVYTQSFATQVENFPQFLEKMPTYDVKIIPSANLPQPNLQLTKRALRILPSYVRQEDKVSAHKVKIPSTANRLILNQTDTQAYCSASTQVCWPKRIEAVHGYLIMTYHNGNELFYIDSKKLGTFLWNETRKPLRSLVEKVKK